MRAKLGAKPRARAKMRLPSARPNRPTTLRAMSMVGIAKSTSVMRMMMVSIQPPKVARNDAGRRPQQGCADDGERGDVQRGAPAEDDAAQHVAPQFVGAEQVLAGEGWGEPVGRIDLVRVKGGDQRREDGHQDQQKDGDGADKGQLVAGKTTDDCHEGASVLLQCYFNALGRHGSRLAAGWSATSSTSVESAGPARRESGPRPGW